MDAERQNRSNAEHAILFEALRRKLAVPVPYGLEINVFYRIIWSSNFLLRDDTSYLTKVIQSLSCLCPWIKGLERRTATLPMEWFRCAFISFNVFIAVCTTKGSVAQCHDFTRHYLTVWHAVISCFSSDIFGYVRISNETMRQFVLFSGCMLWTKCLFCSKSWQAMNLMIHLEAASRSFEAET